MPEITGARTITVRCPTHNIDFTADTGERIVCPAGLHALAQQFPVREFWEYCCDCQRFWPWDLNQAGRGESQCPVCERDTARRYLCNQCKLISVDSDDAARRKAFSISADGRVQPSCPSCLRPSSPKVFAHDCQESGTSFVTAFDVCPLCDKSLTPQISFPSKVNDVLKSFNGSSQEVSFDPASNTLLPSSGGKFLLILSGHGSRLPIVVPRQARIATKQEYFDSWYELFDCDNPAPGEITILSPAVVEAVEEGWKLREVGRIEIKPDAVPVKRSSKPKLACSNCGEIGQPGNVFCKSCGNRLVAEPAPARTVTKAVVNPVITDVSEQFAAVASSPQTTAPVLQSKGPPVKAILFAILAVAAFVILLSVVIYNAGSDSKGRKLDDAIAKGNLFSPPGESAYDLYYQLKNSGATAVDLAKYEQRLLPLLTKRPNEMIAQLSEPGGDDPTAGEWEEARKQLSWASELKTTDKQLAAKTAYCAGRFSYLGQNYDQAQQLWAHAAELDTAWALPLNGVGLIYSNRKDYSAARGYYFDAVRREPNWGYPYNNIGTSYYMEKNYVQAKNYYQKAVQLVPHWARPHSWLGDIAMKERDFATAATEFAAVLDANATGTRNMDLDKIRKQLELAQAQQNASTP